MKQFHLTYDNDKNFEKELEEIRQWCDRNTVYKIVFRLFTEDMDKSRIMHVCEILDREMPEALYFGCTSNANILDGVLAEAKIILMCTVFEYETTQMLLLQFPFLEENYKDAVDGLKRCCEENPWVNL